MLRPAYVEGAKVARRCLAPICRDLFRSFCLRYGTKSYSNLLKDDLPVSGCTVPVCNLQVFKEGIDIIFRPSPDLTLIRPSCHHTCTESRAAAILCASILRIHWIC